MPDTEAVDVTAAYDRLNKAAKQLPDIRSDAYAFPAEALHRLIAVVEAAVNYLTAPPPAEIAERITESIGKRQTLDYPPAESVDYFIGFLGSRMELRGTLTPKDWQEALQGAHEDSLTLRCVPSSDLIAGWDAGAA